MPTIKYKLKDGTKCPGVTTVLGVLNKPALVPWANKIGLEGHKLSDYVDDLADIGTLAHAMVLAHWKNEKYETKDYSQEQISKAENCFLKYLAWEKGKKIEPILVEEHLISEEDGYGGTPDFYGKIDGVVTLLDLKTGKGIYDESFIQLAAYGSLLLQNGKKKPINHMILRIGRSEDEGFEERNRTALFIEGQIFEHCLSIYNLKKQMEKE